MTRGLLLIGAASLFAVAAVFAQPLSSPTDDEGGEHSEMHERMEAIEDHLRFLRRSLRKPEQDAESLEKIVATQMELLICKGLDPERAAAIPEADRAEFLRGYKKEMIVALQGMLKLEQAILDGDHEAAKEIFKDVKRVEKSGHAAYRDEEEEG